MNLTWLANANLAAPNAFGTAGINPDGRMSWNTAQNWIASMNLARHLGFSTWRLPVTPAQDPVCSGAYACTGSEMGHLFYTELGGQVGKDISGAHNSNYSLFSNLEDGSYWSGTTVATTGAWTFAFDNGSQVAATRAQTY